MRCEKQICMRIAMNSRAAEQLANSFDKTENILLLEPSHRRLATNALPSLNNIVGAKLNAAVQRNKCAAAEAQNVSVESVNNRLVCFTIGAI